VVSLTPRLVYPRGKSSQYPSDRSLVAPEPGRRIVITAVSTLSNKTGMGKDYGQMLGSLSEYIKHFIVVHHSAESPHQLNRLVVDKL
jgi:hypothetical protein